MTSGFLTPSPLSVPYPRNHPSFGQILATPSPQCRRHMYMPPILVVAADNCSSLLQEREESPKKDFKVEAAFIEKEREKERGQ